jgi:Mg2+/Co2+ transporter CorB
MAYFCIVLLLLGSAFFSGTEIAYTSLSKLKMKKESDKLTSLEKLVNFIYNHYEYALSTVLVGNNLVNIAATSVATVIALHLAESMNGKITDDAASSIVTVVMTVVILIVGEITPKMIARRCNEKFANFAAYPLMILLIAGILFMITENPPEFIIAIFMDMQIKRISVAIFWTCQTLMK